MVDPSPARSAHTWERAAARLDELATIEAGWLDPGVGEPLSPVARSLIERLLADLTALEVRPPALFLTEDGGVDVRWGGPGPVTIEVTPGEDLTVFGLGRGAEGDDAYVELRADDLAAAAQLVVSLLAAPAPSAEGH